MYSRPPPAAGRRPPRPTMMTHVLSGPRRRSARFEGQEKKTGAGAAGACWLRDSVQNHEGGDNSQLLLAPRLDSSKPSIDADWNLRVPYTKGKDWGFDNRKPSAPLTAVTIDRTL